MTLNQSENSRYRLFQRHPALGLKMLLTGLGIPGATVVLLALLAPDFFFGSMVGRGLFLALVAVAVGVAVHFVQRWRANAIQALTGKTED